ncbi:MAG: hypothetical protein KG028_14165 [Actinobacteria bacterium]|nr:hypothetical protein [Actinomycetota bacterium]
MWTPKFLTNPVRIARLVDEAGQVLCPVSARDVDFERCLACSALGDLTSHDGEVSEIVCQPRLGALIAGV